MFEVNNYPHPQKFEREQADFYTSQVRGVPHAFKPFIRNKFSRTLKKSGLTAANIELLRMKKTVSSAEVKLTSSDEEICDKAEALSKRAAKIIAVNGFLTGCQFAELEGVMLPDTKKFSEVGIIARLSCGKWWRRQLRKNHGRAVEGAAVELWMVHSKGQLYASNATLESRTGQRRRNLRILEEVMAVNEQGKEYTLAELAALSVSNPVIRRGELMTRIAGFDEYAQQQGRASEFWTLTAPGRMHAKRQVTDRRSGKDRRQGCTYDNQKYDGSTPREVQAYLNQVWSRARAGLARHGVEFYGFRVAEPHHDGCPHWHLMLFIEPGQVVIARDIMQRYALQTDGGEPGAQQHRFTAKALPPGTRAAGYLAKYIAKNIDGFGIDRVDEDLTGKRDPMECARRVDAWASTWGVRQFQQIGGHSVTVWRELRRLPASATAGTNFDAHRAAADVGDWCEYLIAQDAEKLSLFRVWSDEPGQYTEPKGWQVEGVTDNGEHRFKSREHIWTISRGKKSQTADALVFDFESAAPWSPVNNCTPENLMEVKNLTSITRLEAERLKDQQQNEGFYNDGNAYIDDVAKDRGNAGRYMH